MPDDFYPFVDSGDPAPDNAHLTGSASMDDGDGKTAGGPMRAEAEQAGFATRIAVYDDMLSTPRVLVIAPKDVRAYLEEITNTVYRCMKEQGGGISLMVIREIVENFIHADFVEPIISILDDGNTIRFADQGPGIEDKERAFEFGVTSADRNQKRYIRGTGAGFPMVQQYLEHAGGAISIEDNLHQGTVVTVSIDPSRVAEIEGAGARGAAVRGAGPVAAPASGMTGYEAPAYPPAPAPNGAWPQNAGGAYPYQMAGAYPTPQAAAPYGYPMSTGAYPGVASMPQAAGAVWPPQTPGGYGQTWPGATPQTPQTPSQQPFVSERGAMALEYLAMHGSCGPTDLAGAYGSSAPTWSRELDALGRAGLVVKRGQKRFPTEAGNLWIQQNRQTKGGDVTHG